MKMSIVLLCTLFSFTAQKPSTYISIVQDVTSEHIKRCTVSDVRKLLPKDEVFWNAVTVRIRIVSDLYYDDIVTVSIPAKSKWQGNKYFRKKEIKAFYLDLDRALDRLDTLRGEKNQSFIFNAIAEELNYQVRTNSENMSQLIYSDMMENNNLISFYKEHLALLKPMHRM